MLHQILDVLHGRQDVSAWQVREMRKRSRQRFLNKAATECVREADSLSWEVEILVQHYPKRKGKDEAATGSARFTLDAAGLAGLGKALDTAVASAQLVRNEPYTLADPGPQFPRVPLDDAAVSGPDAAKELEALEARLRAAAAKEGPDVRLAAGEFFADTVATRFFNSQGLHAADEATLFSGEFALLAKTADGADEREVFRHFKRRRFCDYALEEEVAKAAREGRDRARAAFPPTGTFDVALSGAALDHLFDWLASQSSAAARYNRVHENALGAQLVAPEPGCDAITLWQNGTLPYAVGSCRFDAWGTPSQRRLIVDRGLLHAWWGNVRYAQYLKAPATGEANNWEVSPGKAAAADLLASGDAPLLHLWDFSVFEPNAVTGEFSAEIRMGELITASGRSPVSGGSVSGSCREAFRRIRLSAETEQRERYLGPKVVRLAGLTLAGE